MGVKPAILSYNPNFPAKAQNDRSFLFLLSGPKLPSVPGFLQRPLDFSSLPCPGCPGRNGRTCSCRPRPRPTHSTPALRLWIPSYPSPRPPCVIIKYEFSYLLCYLIIQLTSKPSFSAVRSEFKKITTLYHFRLKRNHYLQCFSKTWKQWFSVLLETQAEL